MTQQVLIVLLPHPDDEFAVFGWIRDAVRNGHSVHCLWLTNGGWGGQEVARRRMESEKVLTRMGLASSNLHFLGERHSLPDGELYRHIIRAHDVVVDCIGRIGQNAQVLVPAWEGGHQDHDIAHLIGAALARDTRLDILQYPIYQGQGLAGPMFRVMSPLTENGPTRFTTSTWAERVRYGLNCLNYRSQWKSFAGLLPFYALRMLSQHPFKVQALQAGRTSQRPHAGALLYERRGGPPHDAIIAAGKALEAHLLHLRDAGSEII